MTDIIPTEYKSVKDNLMLFLRAFKRMNFKVRRIYLIN